MYFGDCLEKIEQEGSKMRTEMKEDNQRKT